MDWGIKITVPGKAVTSTDERDFSLWSKYANVMRLQDTGSGTKAIDATGGSTTMETITHSLGYVPFFVVYIRWKHALLTPQIIEDGTYGSTEPLAAGIDFQAKVNTTQLILRWLNTFGWADYSCDYWYAIGRDPVI